MFVFIKVMKNRLGGQWPGQGVTYLEQVVFDVEFRHEVQGKRPNGLREEIEAEVGGAISRLSEARPRWRKRLERSSPVTKLLTGLAKGRLGENVRGTAKDIGLSAACSCTSPAARVLEL